LRACHKLDSDSRAPRSGICVVEVKEVVAVHGGSGGVTGPCVSLKQVAASALGEIVAIIGAVTGEQTEVGSETCAGFAWRGGNDLSRGGR
jgi:hypothetical protein